MIDVVADDGLLLERDQQAGIGHLHDAGAQGDPHRVVIHAHLEVLRILQRPDAGGIQLADQQLRLLIQRIGVGRHSAQTVEDAALAGDMSTRLAVDVHGLPVVVVQQRIRHRVQLIHALLDAIDCRRSGIEVVGEDGAQPVAVDGSHGLGRGYLVHHPPRGADQVVPAAAPAAVDDALPDSWCAGR